MTDELTLEILERVISQIRPLLHPKRMKVSYGDYRRMREACDSLGILPEIKTNVSPGFGMEIVPSLDIKDNQWEFEF